MGRGRERSGADRDRGRRRGRPHLRLPAVAQHGIASAVYEASDRVGGRTRTLRGFFADGQIVEQGGEAVDTDHHALRSLVSELDLRLDDTYAETPGGLRSNRFQFDRRRYPYHRAVKDFEAVYPALQRDLRGFERSPRIADELDNMSMADWISTRVPGGLDSQLGRLIREAYSSEDGAPAEVSSAIAADHTAGRLAPPPAGPVRRVGRALQGARRDGPGGRSAGGPAAGRVDLLSARR